MNKVFAILLVSIFAAFTGTAQAVEKELDANGLYNEPICDYDFRVKKSLTILGEKFPTGLKVSTDKWDMEIYAAKDGAWTLIGKSKDPAARSTHICRLASSIDKPYAKEKWFVDFYGAK